MSLMGFGTPRSRSGFPRVSGDEPGSLRRDGDRDTFSPRERG